MGIRFDLAPIPMSEVERVRTLAKQLQGPAHLAQVLADIPDPMLRAEVWMMMVSLVDFEVPDETEEPDEDK